MDSVFFDYYKGISDVEEKRRLRKQVIENCEIEPTTFYSWLYRKKVPRLAQKVIAQILNKPQTELFPETNQ